MVEFCEAVMVILFGVSWPMNIIKSLKSKTAKGKSLVFLFLIFTGYIFAITGKLYGILVLGYEVKYVLIFYFINLLMVGFDIILYFRNRYLDKKNS